MNATPKEQSLNFTSSSQHTFFLGLTSHRNLVSYCIMGCWIDTGTPPDNTQNSRRGTWCHWNTWCSSNHLILSTLCSATHYRYAHYRNSAHSTTSYGCHYWWRRSDLHPLGEDLLPNSGWD